MYLLSKRQNKELKTDLGHIHFLGLDDSVPHVIFSVEKEHGKFDSHVIFYDDGKLYKQLT